MRYNQSTIYGLSKYYNKAADPTGIKWLNQADEQTDGKATWQLALKKKVNDELTLRATGGTYYRLLNMYEIAGDGAGILPMPNIHSNGTQSVFPQPEEGTQWDLSAIWDKTRAGRQEQPAAVDIFSPGFQENAAAGRLEPFLLCLYKRRFGKNRRFGTAVECILEEMGSGHGRHLYEGEGCKV